MSSNPIGIFDSGVGGTSIWREIKELMPYENTIYLADSLNAPYGPKGKDKIIELSVSNTEWLLEKECKLIVVACNTATTNAISHLRDNYDIPFIGIEPAIKPAALNTKTKAVGILATAGTLSSSLFHETSGKFAKDVTVIETVGDGIVELIENGKLNSPEMTALLIEYLEPMLKENIDYLVLGCTHYPYLIPQLKELLPENVTIIDSGLAVARQTKNILEQESLLNQSSKPSIDRFYSTKNPDVLRSILGENYPIKEVEVKLLEELLFVYNANSGTINAIMDAAHKVISPSTYNCDLCALTYDFFTENKEWKKFRENQEMNMRFLHKDEFESEFPNKKYNYPTILKRKGSIFAECISANELKTIADTSELINKVENSIP